MACSEAATAENRKLVFLLGGLCEAAPMHERLRSVVTKRANVRSEELVAGANPLEFQVLGLACYVFQIAKCWDR